MLFLESNSNTHCCTPLTAIIAAKFIKSCVSFAGCYVLSSDRHLKLEDPYCKLRLPTSCGLCGPASSCVLVTPSVFFCRISSLALDSETCVQYNPALPLYRYWEQGQSSSAHASGCHNWALSLMHRFPFMRHCCLSWHKSLCREPMNGGRIFVSGMPIHKADSKYASFDTNDRS